MNKSRYLQLSTTTMMEYIMQGEGMSDISEYLNNEYMFMVTDLKDDHRALFSPAQYEFRKTAGKYAQLRSVSKNEIVTNNTLNHLCVPKDEKSSSWYIFSDPDYQYINDLLLATSNDTIANILGDSSDSYSAKLLCSSYSKYCKNPILESSRSPFYIGTSDYSYAPKWDTIKLYFITGYDFSDTNAIQLRVFVNRKDERQLDLTNFLLSKSNAYRYMHYLVEPIVFGNFIYDRYIEIKVPCLYDLTYGQCINDPDKNSLAKLCDIDPISPIKIVFAYIDSDSISYENAVLNDSPIMLADITEDKHIAYNANADFVRTSKLSGSIPTAKTASDNMGVYIAECADMPYIEFYGTWKEKAITYDIANAFNKTILLYNQKIVNGSNVPAYEVEENYSVETNMSKWMAIHTIICHMYDNEDKEIDNDSYSVNQTFDTVNSRNKFYYRPSLLNVEGKNIAYLKIEYNMRFINTQDGVQITKCATLSQVKFDRYYMNASKIDVSNKTPYKVYNKIDTLSQALTHRPGAPMQAKYVKVFYDSTNVAIDVNGQAISNGEYTLKLSIAPKTYKFVFTNTDNYGKRTYMDLTGTYYKLYGKDANNNDIIIEPTYSKNMNTLLGELEFNLSSTTVNKLYSVSPENRKLSIVAYNQDNSISSLYDFKYTF